MSLIIRNGTYGSFFYFNNKIVKIGYGNAKSDTVHMRTAAQEGFRMFDGAWSYKDGTKLRDALKGRIISDFIICSKIPSSKLDPNRLEQSTIECYEEIATDLDVTSIDVMYLHGPDCLHDKVFNGLMRLLAEGKIKHIGVSNIDKATLEKLILLGLPIRVVQNEFNPYYWDEEILQFCRKNQIVFVGYRPFGDKMSDEICSNEILQQIAQKVKRTTQAVILQWMYQKGVTAIPHAKNKQHMQDNLQALNCSLTNEEMVAIDGIKAGKKSTCNWQKFIMPEHLDKSRNWLASL